MLKSRNRRPQDEQTAPSRAASWLSVREADKLRDQPLGFMAMPRRNPAFIYKRGMAAPAQI